MILLLGAIAPFSYAGGSKPKSVIRIHMEEVATNNTNQVFPVQLSKPAKQILVKRFADLTENHVESMGRVQGGQVLVRFNSTGKNILEAITSQNLGRIMVVLFNNRIVYSPRIDVPLRNGMLLLPPVIFDEEIVGMNNTVEEIKRKRHFN